MLKKYKKRIYDFILPFGEACFTAFVMKRIKVRTQSGPFDWMYGATFEDRFNIILNKFENFFNKEDFVYEKKDVACDAYMNTRTHICFNHDFPHDVNFDEYFPVVKQKYQKRIERTLEEIGKSKKVLLLYIDLPDTKRGLDNFEKLPGMMTKLSEVYPNTEFDLLYIKHNSNLKQKEVVYNLINEHIIIAECYNKATDPKAEDWQANKKNTVRAMKIIGIKHPIINYLRWEFQKYSKKLRKCVKK